MFQKRSFVFLSVMVLAFSLFGCEADSNKDWGSEDIPGTHYSVSLSTRFYDNKLLYILRITPFDNKVKQFARTVSVDLQDKDGFVLAEIDSTLNWTTTVDSAGKEVELNTRGSIPITFRGYLEIYSWGPRWRSNF